ncbi:hypothetical protein [Chloroherpeton thalassium]|nr:hypothetical protein [Chloroherpeton thalassium]
MDSKLASSAVIITGVATAEAASAYVMSPTLIGDDIAVTALTAAMIMGLGKVHNKSLTMEKALKWLIPNMGLFASSRVLAMTVKWIPLIGTTANASISFTAAQVIGWTVYLIFNDDKELDEVGVKELRIYKRRAENMEKPDVEKWFEDMPKEQVKEYKDLVSQLSKPGLTEEQQNEILRRMQDLVAPYATGQGSSEKNGESKKS